MPEMAFLKGEVNFKAYDCLHAALPLLSYTASVTEIVMHLFSLSVHKSHLNLLFMADFNTRYKKFVIYKTLKTQLYNVLFFLRNF